MKVHGEHLFQMEKRLSQLYIDTIKDLNRILIILLSFPLKLAILP